MNINYNYFFRVELLHKYFTDGVCNDFVIAPSLQTRALLSANKILAKQYGNTLFTGMQTDDAGKAFITPSPNLQLTFFMQLINPVFFNYTNLPSAHKPGKIYYFTNRNNNISNAKNFISHTTAYDATKQYHPGDISTDNTGEVFQCISSCKNVAPSTAAKINWMKVDNNHYVSEADALQWMPSVSTYSFTAAQPNAVIEAWAYKPADKNFTDKVITQTITFKQPAKNFKLDLSKLSPGKYKLNINNVIQWIYINDELSANPTFAVIEIFNDTNLPAAYTLLNGVVLKSPLYTINFLNRATIWKYVLNAGSKGSITVNPADFAFPGTAQNIIFSQAPIPLSEKALNVSLALSTVNNAAVNPAISIKNVACASPQTLINFSKGTDKFACSEIFLNH